MCCRIVHINWMYIPKRGMASPSQLSWAFFSGAIPSISWPSCITRVISVSCCRRFSSWSAVTPFTLQHRHKTEHSCKLHTPTYVPKLWKNIKLFKNYCYNRVTAVTGLNPYFQLISLLLYLCRNEDISWQFGGWSDWIFIYNIFQKYFYFNKQSS